MTLNPFNTKRYGLCLTVKRTGYIGLFFGTPRILDVVRHSTGQWHFIR